MSPRFTAGELGVLWELCRTLLRGGDHRVLMRSREFASALKKMQDMLMASHKGSA